MPKTREATDLSHKLMWRLFNAAENHGNESDPEHEVGDLQEIAMAGWRHLTDEQAQAAYDECSDLMDIWGTEDEDDG